MDFNTSKCKALNISKKKSPTVRNYQLNNESLVTVKEITDLGISINDKLLWSSHIAQISKRANRILGLVKRLCRDFPDSETRQLSYCQIIRPILEKLSELWSPCTIKQQMILENVQRVQGYKIYIKLSRRSQLQTASP